MISWGTPNAATPLQPSDHTAMEAALAPYSWLRAFPGAVVVTITAEADRVKLQDQLTAAAAALGNRAHVLMSPGMQGSAGIYRGLLASNLWEQLNKKTVE